MFNFIPTIILSLLFLIFPINAHAFKAETFITFSNPVTGYEGWNNPSQTPLDLPKFIYQESTPSALPITWLLRYDALESSTISGYFKDLIAKDKNQDLGLFLTITPELVNKLGISYPQGFSEHNANRVFLSGYQDTQRKQIIDLYMSIFFNKFGFYPKSVSAWHLDSFSLQYLAEKYSVLTAMNCDDQYSMDQYRLWGGYVGSPYFPDKNNSLIPARSLENRVNLAMVRWAPRDFYNFYGTGVSSMFSFQINDYLGLGLNHSYFQNLLKQYSQKNFNEFTHLNLGLENGYSLVQYKSEIKKVIQDLNAREAHSLHPISLANFGDWFKARYPESSPTYFYRTKDTAGTSKEEVSWYQSPWYRLGLKSNQGKTSILDLRVYNREIYEDHYNTANQGTSLFHEIPAIIDTVKFPNDIYSLDFNLPQSILLYNKYTDFWQATLVDGDKKLILAPDKIIFVGFQPPQISSTDIKVTTEADNTSWLFIPETPYKNKLSLLWPLLFLYLVYLIVKRPNPPIFGLLLCFVAASTLYKNGQLFSYGMGFWGPNGHDALFHLSLIEHFRQNLFSLSHPQFSGANLQDYHFLFDYLLGFISKITFTQSSPLYFIVFPVFLGIALVVLIDSLLTHWNFNQLQKNLAYLFVFLGGSLGFIPRLISGQNIYSGESAFWANQSASMFLNPPFILSLAILLLFMRCLELPKNKKISTFLWLSALGGLLAQTKVYAFLLLLFGLLIAKKYKLFIAIFALGGLLTLLFTSFSGSPFVFQPLWFIKSMLESPDRVYWQKAAEAWQAYEANGLFLKLLILNIAGLAIYLFGNLGIRVIGFKEMFSKTSQPSQKIVWAIILAGLFVPLIITQKINPWNTVQFTYYSLFFLGIFSGKVIGAWHGSKVSAKTLILIPVLLISIFTSFGTLKDYYTYKSASRISYTELGALRVLRSQARGLVLAPVYTENTVATPKPQYSYVSSSYISALTGQPELLSDTINLDITGISFQNRFNDVQKFYNSEDKIWTNEFLQKNNIKYIYETPLKRLKLNPFDLRLTTIYDSGEIKVYKTN